MNVDFCTVAHPASAQTGRACQHDRAESRGSRMASARAVLWRTVRACRLMHSPPVRKQASVLRGSRSICRRESA